MEILTVESLKKIYGNKQFMLDNINMQVERGSFVAILGDKMAGKTPLLQVITGRKWADKGKVSFYGKDIRKMPLDSWKQIGWIPDDIMYYENRTVKRIFERTISWTQRGTMERAKELCRIFDIDMNQYILELSDKQNRCVSFINTVFTNPELICMDELYHHLDERTYLQMLDLLGKLCERGTTVIASFDEYEKISGYCDNYILLSEGDCVAQGSINKDYIPLKMVSMNLGTCFRETVSEGELLEYVDMFVTECRELADAQVIREGDKLLIPYNGDLTVLSHLFFKYGCEDYLIEKMTMEEHVQNNYTRWQE